MLAFERPFLLAFLALIPVFMWLSLFLGKRGLPFPLVASREKAAEPSPSGRGRPALAAATAAVCEVPFFPRACRKLAILLFYCGLALTVIAAAGPARVSRRILYLSRGNEIIFVLDVSPSMAAADFQPDRLESAKAIIDGFLSSRRNESIGLVAFGAEAALVCPPTLDYPALRRSLLELKPGIFGDGTALGSGLATALAHSASSQAPEKYIVLLTDGENNAGAMAPATVVAMAARRGVSVSVVGVGSKGEVPLSYVDPATGLRRTGSYRSDFDSASLEALARAGSGNYYAAESVNALRKAFDSISERSSSLARTRSVSEEESLLGPVLGLGLAALVLARLLELLSGGGFL